MRALAHGGLRGVIMSIDAHDVVRHERHRRLPGVCHKIQRANQMFAALGIQTIASITVIRLIDDYRQLPGFLTRLGFQSCTFSYPLTALGSSYRGCSHSPLVAYQPEELLDIFEQLRELKRRTRFPVLQSQRFPPRNAAASPR